MNQNNLNKKVASSIFWKLSALFLNGGLSLVIRLVLAYLLSPNEFGLVGMAVIFTGLIEIISEQGIAQAVIQKRQINENHLNVAYSLSLLIGVVCFILVLFGIGPFAAWFFAEDLLVYILPVISISLLLRPFRIVPLTVLTRELKFKEISIIEIISISGSSLITLLLAFLGAGIWSMVLTGLIQTIIAVPLFNKYYSVKNKWMLEKKEVDEIKSFGIYVVMNNILIYITKNIDYLFIGRMLGSVQLGVYTFAFFLTDFLRVKFMSVMNNVMYPVYSKVQDQKNVIRKFYLTVIKINSFVIFPIMTVFISSAEKLIVIAYPDNSWADAVEPLKILSLSIIIHTIGGTSASILRAIGMPKLEFKISIYETFLVSIPLLFFGIYYFGIIGASWAVVISKICSRMIYQYFMRKYLDLTEIEIIKAISVPFLLCIGLYYINIISEKIDYSSSVFYLINLIINVLFYFISCGFLLRKDIIQLKNVVKKN